MINLYSSINISFGNVPLSKYKGPLLALTAEEKIYIEKLQKEKAQLIMDLNKLHHIYGGRRLRSTPEQFYHGEWDKLENRIEAITEEIRAIKINRHNIQVQSSNYQQ